MRKSAWTLMELVVVMGILVVLFGLFVLPLYHLVQYVRHLGGH